MDMDNWKHRSKGMRCITCIFFVEKEQIECGNSELISKAGRPGRCRRHAPTMNGFPVVFESDWCGDHKLDEGKI